MGHQNLIIAAVLAGGAAALTGMSAPGLAETVTVPDGIAIRDSDVATPTRGMSMNQVAHKFGAPITKVPAVGKPPISRWEYPGFIVYFELDHVIHSVAVNT